MKEHDGTLMVIRSYDIIMLVEKIKGQQQKPKNPDNIRSAALTDVLCSEEVNRCNITGHTFIFADVHPNDTIVASCCQVEKES